ncbi:GNAT family N-acetyltransferase [Lentibacillus halophilus]|uniref:GNAT family N-acetyltransferase n=1 Tax=Lentibacillus halophilus TaxID=295065 RepID=A0ABP3IX98_9BACI
MDIREIEMNDNQALKRIIKWSLEDAGLNIPGTAYFDPQLGYLSQFYKEKPGAKYWVVVTDANEVAGGAGIAPYAQNSDVGELQKLYIAPEFRGKGLSKQLMTTALDFASKHYTYCYLETSRKLEIASYLYRQFGFQELNEPLDGSEHGAMDDWYIKKLV